jgi:hypothetical protein
MHRFRLYILALLALVVILLFFLDTIYTYTYSHGTPRNKISYLLSKEKINPEYIFLGSSRVDNNIDSEIIKKETGETVLNLGIQGAKLNDIYAMLRLIENQKLKPKAIFIQVDYIYNLNGESEFLTSYLIPYIKKNATVAEIIQERHDNYFYLQHVPFYRYMLFDYKIGFREMINAAIGNNPSIDLSNGFHPLPPVINGSLKSTLPKSIKERNEVLDKIRAFANTRKLRLIYFTAPFCRNTENFNFIQKLEKKIPGILNFSKIYHNKDDFFFNCTHLNEKGARDFSKLLGEEIKRLDS